MTDILNSFTEAFNLIFSLDREIYGIILLTLFVTVFSTIISSVIGISSGVVIGSKEFKGKKQLVRVVQTLMGLPPVVVGVLVYLMLSRKGPLGELGLLFTAPAMVIAQVIIVTPIIMGLTISAIKSKAECIEETCKGLGLGYIRTLAMLILECRYQLTSVVLAGYGRAISEVGAVMLVGGNIQYHTRVITTSIVLETGKGNYDKGLALGIILLLISFIINWTMQRIQEV
ncbi:ABC transporter permease [Pseudobacteroides cellulosolvens]|uniref:ABC-type transporter, integral membrane subunit n=1 Tax=Pseudobacteroides cellulosolvens ATCC 35603 = DSM 2933 TaxID=398512 RepID=A0A0L6JSL3_9FIRM|nr:ABC transporter permease [Pseudobacteroides cellulosolvens]KNY28412.1 ABC-type transporter, integral membrane subunit [Pseudobacteroides cellulosolvens ATCC 35603 = DSM 2933]